MRLASLAIDQTQEGTLKSGTAPSEVANRAGLTPESARPRRTGVGQVGEVGGKRGRRHRDRKPTRGRERFVGGCLTAPQTLDIPEFIFYNHLILNYMASQQKLNIDLKKAVESVKKADVIVRLDDMPTDLLIIKIEQASAFLTDF